MKRSSQDRDLHKKKFIQPLALEVQSWKSDEEDFVYTCSGRVMKSMVIFQTKSEKKGWERQVWPFYNDSFLRTTKGVSQHILHIPYYLRTSQEAPPPKDSTTSLYHYPGHQDFHDKGSLRDSQTIAARIFKVLSRDHTMLLLNVHSRSIITKSSF